MTFDQPLRIINSKLPAKQPGFYLKLMVFIFFAAIPVFISVQGQEVNQTVTALVGFAVAFLAFSSFFALVLAHLYNVHRQESDYVNVHAPIITTSKTLNKISDSARSFIRFLTVIYAYLLLLFVVGFPVMAVVGAIAS